MFAACDHDAKPKTDEVKAQAETKVEKQDRIWVYIDNGALQCQKSANRLGQTRATLLTANIEVSDSKCAHITGSVSATMCGLKDLGIHIHQIKRSDAKRARSFGFEPVESLSHYGNKSYKVSECPT